MKNLKIGKKLGISFIVLLMITAFANFYALSNFKKAGKLSHDLFKGPYVVTNQTAEIRRDVASIDDNIMNAIFADNLAEYKTFAIEDFDSINERIKILRENFSGDEKDKELIDNLESSIANLRQQYEKIYELIEQGHNKTAEEMATNESSEYCQAYNKCEELSITISKEAQADGIEFDKKIQDTVSKVRFISTTLSVFAMIVGAVICRVYYKELKAAN